MERIGSRSSPGGYTADVFKQSLSMSTYLVAFAVFDFASKSFTTPRGTFMRAWSRPAYVNQLDYSLGISGLLLEAFEDYTGLAQPLSKTDQIAVPSLRPGAMENWGMITYREPYILYNPQYSTTSNQIALANYISHEISHTFFGNLVTCEWWEDVFLHEGFATYFAIYGLKTIYPTWKMEEEFGRLFLVMMFYDGLPNSQPIHLTGLEHPKDLSKAFNSVTYRKGAAIIRMVNYFLGQDTFRTAMRIYLRRHAYGSVRLQDLFDVLEEQAKLDDKVTWDEGTSNITSIMSNWLDQQGYPVVKVTNIGGGNYTVTQELFLMAGKPRYPSPYGFKWDIPFTYSSRAQMDQNQSSLVWMHQTDLELTGLDPDFILGNYRRQGFYRVNYDNQSWAKIIQLLNNNHQKIDVFTRAQLVDDSLTFAEMGLLTEVEGLRVTEYLRTETEYLPWYAALRRLTYFNNVFKNTETYEAWQRYMLNLLVTKLYDFVGWDDSDPLEHHEKGIRSTVISRACSMGYGPCRQEARRLYRTWMKNENNNPIPSNLRYAVYCEAIRSGGSAEWEFAYKMYQKKYEGYIAGEKSTLQKALACSRMPWIARKYLKMVISWGSTSRVSSVAFNPVGAPLVWDLLMTKWTSWPKRLSKSTILRTLTRTYSTEQDLQKFEAFVSKYPDDKLKTTYRSIRSGIKRNMKWLEKNEMQIRAWLNAANSRTRLQQAAMEAYDDTFMFMADQDDIFAF